MTTQEITTQEMMAQIAKDTGVDITAVETMAKMCADRISKWGVAIDSDSVTAAVMDSKDAYRSMTNSALTKMHHLAPAIKQAI